MQCKVKHIAFIDFLRYVAMVEIFLSHFHYKNIPPIFSGSLGVSIFFMISGLLLVYPERNLEYFWRKKAVKLLPLYYLATLLVYIISKVFVGLTATPASPPITLLKSIVFIPHVIENDIRFIYPALWFIYIEVFVQLIFFIFAKILKSRYKAAFPAIGVILGMNILSYYLHNPYLNFYGNVLVFYFIPGFVTGLFLQKVSLYEKNWAGFSSLVIVIAGTIATLFYATKYTSNLFNICLQSILFFTAINIFYNIRVPSIIKYLSKISYSFYIIHYFVIRSFFVFIYDRIINKFIPIYIYIYRKCCIMFDTCCSYFKYQLLYN